MQTEQLQELLIDCIRDIYDAEKQLVSALPKMAKAAEAEELVSGIELHLEETKKQVTRLEEVFKLLGVAAKGKSCKAMKGLIEEGSEAMEDGEAGPLRDLAIIAAAQKVEHYEISAYGTARTIAEQLDNRPVVERLQQTQDEEIAADESLTEVAMMLYGSGDKSEVTAAESGGKRMSVGSQAGKSPAKKKAAAGRT